MKKLYLPTFTLVLSTVIFTLSGQTFTQLSGFDIIKSFDKQVYNIDKLNDSTCLINFTKPKMLWRSDGTVEGTYLLHNWEGENQLTNGKFLNLLGVVDGKAIMLISTTNFGKEIWVSDGTVSGTHILVDFYPGPSGITSEGNWNSLAVFNDNAIYFLMRDSSYIHLMRTDGTVNGTYIYLDKITETIDTEEDMSRLFYINGYFYFVNDQKLFQINKLTNQINKFNLSLNINDISDIAQLNDGNLLFVNIHVNNGEKGLFRFELSNSKLIQLAESNTAFDKIYNSLYHRIIKNFKGSYYVNTSDPDFKILYKTDGTIAGTKFLGYFIEDNIEHYFEYNDKLYFGNNFKNHFAIYSLDSLDNLKMLLDSKKPSDLARRGFSLMSNNLFFSGSGYMDTGLDSEPHFYYPESNSVIKLANLNPALDSRPSLFTEINPNKYFFYAVDDVFEGSLYVMNLTSTSTTSVDEHNDIKVFPNPTTDIWNLEMEDPSAKDYFLFNTLGITLKHGVLNGNQDAINSAELSPGCYILRIKSSDQLRSLKLVKQ